MAKESLLLELLGNAPSFKIIDFLVENKGMDFTKLQITKGAEISKATLFNYWPEIEKYGIVKPTRKFGKTVLYTLNSKNPVINKILELESVLIKQAMEKNKRTKEVLA